MEIYEYQKLAMRTCNIPSEDKFNRLVHGVAGLVSELYELEQAEKENDNHEHVTKELGDCFWMIAEICDSVDLKFEDINKSCFMCDMFTLDEGVAELCESVQKYYQHYHTVNVEKVRKGLVRVMAALHFALLSNKVRLRDVLEINIEKLKKRFPDGFDPEKSLHRAEGDI